MPIITQKEEKIKTEVFRKRVGHTNYLVRVHFSEKSSESAQEKILRLARNEVLKS